MNVDKSNEMEREFDCNARIDGETLEVAIKFVYLDVAIDKSGGCEKSCGARKES